MHPFDCPVWGNATRPLSWLYQAGVALKNRKYDRMGPRSFAPDVLVLSVGNITVGGTGKTPLVEHVARFFLSQGRKPAVLSRGYKRRSRGALAVSDGRAIQCEWPESGDEPMLLARKLAGVPVLVGADRRETGRMAMNRFGCDVLVLDDAFQHRRMPRDVDLVMLDATNPWGNGFLLPSGPLREPLKNLKRARAVILSRTDQVTALNPIIEKIGRYTSAPVFKSVHRPVAWVSPDWRDEKPLPALTSGPVVAFSGIGKPQSFQQTLTDIGLHVSELISFPDHHGFSPGDLEKVYRKAKQSGAQRVVATEKDGVKIASWPYDIPLYFLKIEIVIEKEALSPLLHSFK